MKALTPDQQPGAPSGRQRIVIVDDDPFVRAVLASQLSNGFECVGNAAGAQEAIALVDAERPDVVILDMNMPDGGAMHATVQIRERSPDTAIVILSVNETVSDMIDLLNAGAMTYLRKGIDDHSLEHDLTASITAHRHGGRTAPIASDAPLSDVAGGFGGVVLRAVPEPAVPGEVIPTAAIASPGDWLEAFPPSAPLARFADPVAASESAQRAAGLKAFYEGSASSKVTLIVDDDFRNRFALTALLERGRLTVVPAESGIEGLAILAQRSDIDLVLMDIMMPVMDGYETMRAIREMAQWADLPIIAVTGKVDAAERERCIAAGASDYIPKPVDAGILLEAIGRWLPVVQRAQAS
jgi:CheY-like chemotaxis protein